jgi:hypothetical protein
LAPRDRLAPRIRPQDSALHQGRRSAEIRQQLPDGDAAGDAIEDDGVVEATGGDAAARLRLGTGDAGGGDREVRRP